MKVAPGPEGTATGRIAKQATDNTIKHAPEALAVGGGRGISRSYCGGGVVGGRVQKHTQNRTCGSGDLRRHQAPEPEVVKAGGKATFEGEKRGLTGEGRRRSCAGAKELGGQSKGSPNGWERTVGLTRPTQHPPWRLTSEAG